MRRIFLTALAASALCLGAPAVASAHHSRHHARHSRRGHHKARLERFGSLPSSAGVTGSAPQGAPTSPTPPSGETAGKVQELKGDMLTIVLSDEKTLVSGKVTEHTEIHCESATSTESADDQNEQGDSSGGGDNSGGGDSHVGPSSQSDQMTGNGGDDSGGGDDQHGLQSSVPCTTEALKPGTVVREAELSVGGGSGAVWDQIDLIQ